MKPIQHRNKQRGSALLMALMLMTIAAIIATSIAFRQSFSIKRTQQVLTTQQAYLYAQGVNNWAIGKLLANGKKYQDNQNNTTANNTNQLIDIFPMKFEQDINGETIYGEIIDAQSFFNLNTLGSQSSQQAFTTLITLVDPNIKKEQAQQITQATYQWITSLQQIQQQQQNQAQSSPQAQNSNATPANSSSTTTANNTTSTNSTNNSSNNNSTLNTGLGFSSISTAISTNKTAAPQNWDASYLQQRPPYRIPHLPMASASEFRLVHGVTRQLYAALAPYIIALPDMGSLINVNTASSKLLAATAQGLSSTAADLLVQSRVDNPFPSLAAYEGNSALTNATVDASLLTVQSDFFIVKADVKMGDQELIVYSLLLRTGVSNNIPAAAPSTPANSSSQGTTTTVTNDNNSPPSQQPVKVQILWQSIGTL